MSRLTAVLLLAVIAAEGQQPAPQRSGAVNAGVTAVLVDVVVRDRRGQPVRDLKPSDFQVTEDGVPQSIGSFSPVFDGTGTAPPSPAQPSGTAPAAAVGSPAPTDSGPTVTALVFDRLSPEARRLAVDAAQGYLGQEQDTPTYTGIFGIDLGLTPYAPFTRNGRVLRQALGRIASRASASFNNPEAQERKANADLQAATASAAAEGARAAGGGAGTSSAMGTAAGDAKLAQMESRMLQQFDVMERDEQGYSSTNGLFAIIGALRGLPGRKSLVLFSEGIAIPPGVQRLFLGVIDAANRANVSIYTIDAAGLRAVSEQARIRDQVNQAGRRGIESGYAGNTGSDAPLTQELEKNEDVLRQDPQNGLGQLALATGGLFFDNTNNLRRAFDRIEEDLSNYYLIGYTPTNDKYDGRFRTIDVKVNRPGVTIAARKGYFAVRDSGGLPVNAWEASAFGALEQKPVPNAFPVRMAALLFPEPNRPGLAPVIVDFATESITFQAAADGKSYTSDVAVVVRLLNAQNQIVRKMSQHYEINGPMADLERAKHGEVLFYREPELAPGVYTLEAVVHDAPSGKSSVRFSTLEITKQDPGRLRMSSLLLVKRGEKLAEKDRKPDNPLLVNDTLLYPNLGEPVSKASKEVGFYFCAYPVQGGPAPDSTLEILQNGSAVARVPLALSRADALGRIQQVGRLPLAQLAPGTYELRAIVKQGNEQTARTTLVRLVE
jgi:VWFA-related protein